MNIMKRNAHMASEYLTKATRDAETSIKYAHILCSVIEMNKSVILKKLFTITVNSCDQVTQSSSMILFT